MDASNFSYLTVLGLGMDGEEQGRLALVIAGPVMGLVPSLYKPRTRISNGQRTHDNDLERECTPSSALGRFSAKRIVPFRMGMKSGDPMTLDRCHLTQMMIARPMTDGVLIVIEPSQSSLRIILMQKSFFFLFCASCTKGILAT